MFVNVDKIRRKLEAEGFVCPQDDKATVQMAFGLRIAPIICMTWSATGMILASPLILWALVPFAALGALLPGHPFEVIYNFGLRHLFGGSPLPRYPLYRRMVCVVAMTMLLLSGWGFYSGQPLVGYTFSSLIVSTALLYSTTGFCVVSFSLNPRVYLQHLTQ